MKRIVPTKVRILAFGLMLLPLCLSADTAGSEGRQFSDTGFYAAGAELTPSEQAGRDIWYKATAGNGRFHTYVFQQRLGVIIDWYRVLRSDQREERFKIWGLVNNPGCCQPGSPGCPAKSYEETFGLDWCAGDEDEAWLREQLPEPHGPKGDGTQKEGDGTEPQGTLHEDLPPHLGVRPTVG